MEESLKKLSQLPAAVKAKLSSSEFLDSLSALEEKHRAKLTLAFIRLVVGDLSAPALDEYLQGNLRLSETAATEIENQFLILLGHLKSNLAAPAKIEKVAASVFAPEKEVKPASAQNNFIVGEQNNIDYGKIAAEIILKFGYNKKDEFLINRLRQMIVARLKDVRDKLETLDALKKGLTVGGLELNEKDSDRLLALIEEYQGKKQNYQQKAAVNWENFFAPPRSAPPIDLKEKAKQERESLAREIDNLKNFKPAPTVQTAKPLIKTGDLPVIVEEDGLPVIKMSAAGKDDLIIKPQTIDFKKSETVVREPVARPYPPGHLKQSAPAPRLYSQKKPTVDGIKFAKQLVGPIEELGRMTLIDFRRLAETPTKATAKILEKINLLEKESFAKRLAGIAAWFGSEVNKFYRLLGQASLDRGQSIETVIEERIKAGKPTLSFGEFQAVMELNKNLRF